MEIVTFEDIENASVTTETIPSLKKGVKIASVDPVKVVGYLDAIDKARQAENVEDAIGAFVKIRDAVHESLVEPKLTREQVDKIPGRILMEIFDAILGASGMGGKQQEEAEKFREE